MRFLPAAALFLIASSAPAQEISVFLDASAERCRASQQKAVLLVSCDHQYYLTMWRSGVSVVSYYESTDTGGRIHLVLPDVDRVEIVGDPEGEGAPAEIESSTGV